MVTKAMLLLKDDEREINKRSVYSPKRLTGVT
jgi:hypothetical protein